MLCEENNGQPYFDVDAPKSTEDIVKQSATLLLHYGEILSDRISKFDTALTFHECVLRVSEEKLTAGSDISKMVKLAIAQVREVRGEYADAAFLRIGIVEQYKNSESEFGRRIVARTLNHQGYSHESQGNYTFARQCFQEALQVCSLMARNHDRGMTYLGLVRVDLAICEYQSSLSNTQTALSSLRELFVGEFDMRSTLARTLLARLYL
jgi:tetratricopeptide (TPR) repeat protein